MSDPVYDPVHEHGGMSRWAYYDDPRRLAFTLARYKHTAKILEGCGRVLEVGCADGFGTRIVRQHVGELTAIDTDARSIAEAKLANSDRWPVKFMRGDISQFPGPGFHPRFDGVYALDVLEHVCPDGEFLKSMHMAAPLAVIGTPSRESQEHASRLSRLGHVNLYSAVDLRLRLLDFWSHAVVFTMHDETLGTSFGPMAQYLLALCVR